MARSGALKVVPEGAVAPKAQPLTVTQAAAGGSKLDLARALRTRVAKAVENEDTPPRDLAALTKRLQDIAKEIEVLEAAQQAEEAAANDDSSGDAPFDEAAL